MDRMVLSMTIPMCPTCLSGVRLYSQGRLGWMHWGAHLRSSGVPRARRKYTLTGSCCPWRCARSSACSRMATSSGSSTNTTLLAAVKSRPTPAGERADWRGMSYTECLLVQFCDTSGMQREDSMSRGPNLCLCSHLGCIKITSARYCAETSGDELTCSHDGEQGHPDARVILETLAGISPVALVCAAINLHIAHAAPLCAS